MKLAGIDLAWKADKNPSAIAIGTLQNGTLTLNSLQPAVYSIARVMASLMAEPGLVGVAVDASLIINNATGQRPCETALSREYGSRGAGCHASNTTQYPDADSVKLSRQLEASGFQHLAKVGQKFQIECYPHPAMIELFALPERLKYKKGRVGEKKSGQKQLADLIRSLAKHQSLPLNVPKSLARYLDHAYIDSLRGQALKSNEDALDAIICLMIAGLYQVGAAGHQFGDALSGYIWVPKAS